MPENDDWEARYQKQDTPWDKGEASPGLVDFLNQERGLARGTVLVPGCGFGHDVRAWAGAGFAATGLDLAATAIKGAREHAGNAKLAVHYAPGDFLRDPAFELFDWVFEHTLYCAIQPEQRDQYFAAVSRWLQPDGNFLAVHYLIPDTEGPPFGTTRDEVLQRFEPAFRLRREWVPRSYPNRTGLELMLWWQRRT